MTIEPAELRRLSLVTTASITAAAVIWCAAFALTVLLDEFDAPAWLFFASLAACLVAFAYVVASTLVTWAYTSARAKPGPSLFFDGPNPLKRLVIRELIKG